MMRTAALALVLAACGTSDGGLHITGATPGYGPLVGGSQIVVTGSGFATGARALVGGREAPLVSATSDEALAIVVPPGEQSGDAEIVVFDATHSTRATGIFHYSAPPTVTAVTPGDVVYSVSEQVTVTGTGFLDEAAGEPSVFVGGQVAFEARVQSDTELTLYTPPGVPLAQPSIQITNARGTAALAHAFRYTPSSHGGLLLFSAYNGEFAVYFDPIDFQFVSIPLVLAPSSRMISVARDERGDYWAQDWSGRLGHLDLTTQDLAAPVIGHGWFPTMAWVGGELFAIDSSTSRFGKLDPVSGLFNARGGMLPCCGSYGLAWDGTTLWVTTRDNLEGGIGIELPIASATIAPIDPATGAIGAPVPLPPSVNVTGLRFYGGTLYATSSDGTLVTIDPLTGATSVLPANLGAFNSVEIFE